MNFEIDGDKVTLAKEDFLKLLGGQPLSPVIEEKSLAPMEPISLETLVNNYLIDHNFMPNLKGFNCLVTAIVSVIERPALIRLITKELYPLIAKANDTTPSRAERAIRHSIFKVYGEAKTNNGEFIALVANKIKLKGV